MAYSCDSTAGYLSAGWQTAFANSAPLSIALVQIYFNATSSGGNVSAKVVTSSATEFLLINSVFFAGGRSPSGFPAIALGPGDSLQVLGGTSVAWAADAITQSSADGLTATIRQTIPATTWTTVATAAVTGGTKLVTNQILCNSTGGAIAVQMRLLGPTGNPVILGGGNTPLSIPAGWSQVAPPNVGLPFGSSLQIYATGAGINYLAIARSRP